jgi:hypothetical protein
MIRVFLVNRRPRGSRFFVEEWGYPDFVSFLHSLRPESDHDVEA